MASITQTAKGYRAQVYVQGQRDSATFRTKREASAWASARETELREQADSPPEMLHTVRELMTRYRDEITPAKRGARWEALRIDLFLRDPAFPTGKLGEIGPDDFGRWRDARAGSVGPASVIREIGIISAAFEHARREWRWIKANPVRDVRKPRAPEHRQVVLTRTQIKAILRAMHYRPGAPVRMVSQSVAVCLLLALRTGMRAGELCGLTWDRVQGDYCRLPVTKTVPRDVPLTRKAQRLVGKMRGFDPLLVFGLKTASLDAQFRKYRDRAGVVGVTFHDSRHTAATWLAQRIHALDLCRMFGWSNVNQAMTYYNASASDIARRLMPPTRGQTPRSGSNQTC